MPILVRRPAAGDFYAAIAKSVAAIEGVRRRSLATAGALWTKKSGAAVQDLSVLARYLFAEMAWQTRKVPMTVEFRLSLQITVEFRLTSCPREFLQSGTFAADVLATADADLWSAPQERVREVVRDAMVAVAFLQASVGASAVDTRFTLIMSATAPSPPPAFDLDLSPMTRPSTPWAAGEPISSCHHCEAI
jgi:hypothetical protein